MTSNPSVRERHAARIILLDEQDRVLLFEYDDPNVVNPLSPEITRFWCTPGGGLNTGETIEAAAHRELREETGITGVVFSPVIATLSGDLRVGDAIVRHVNHLLAARVIAPELSFHDLEDYERSTFLGHRWWSYEEIIAESADVRPFETVELIRGLVRSNPTIL